VGPSCLTTDIGLPPKMAMIGLSWAIEKIRGVTVDIVRASPSEFTEKTRILPASVSPLPGPYTFDVNPYMREPIDCFDVTSPVREVTLMKGVQITATTVLECIVLYVLACLRTVPAQLFTADDVLAKLRMEAHILPMFEESGLDIFQSPDVKNRRKTGATKGLLQVVGGGYLIISGALSPRRFRSTPVLFSLQDENDGWPLEIGRDGSTSKLADDRTTAYHQQRKILRNSTPLMTLTSVIYRHYLRGDQRKYMVRCLGCDFPQELRWEGKNSKGEKTGGIKWDTEADSKLVAGSVRYECPECGHKHYDQDKERLYSPDNGAEWVPTARPVTKDIRSYHLPGLYSPAGFKTWESCVVDYLDAYDPEAKRVRNMGLYKTFYNNVLGWPFTPPGTNVSFYAASSHRRREYNFGQVPNKYAILATGGPILFLTMQVDVHKHNLAVAVMGWTRDARCFVIEYWRIKDDEDEEGCKRQESPAWARVKELIDDGVWTSDDGREYSIRFAVVDAGYAPDTVSGFCEQFHGVYPIIGRDRPAKLSSIVEFAEYEMKSGQKGYRVTVDHYKDRIAPVLRREWSLDDGEQKRYHFNVPSDMTKKQLEELTKETLTEDVDSNGNTVFKWVRAGNAANELWDLTVYGHAAVDIYAWMLCRGHYQLETVVWDTFWAHHEAELGL